MKKKTNYEIIDNELQLISIIIDSYTIQYEYLSNKKIILISI